MLGHNHSIPRDFHVTIRYSMFLDGLQVKILKFFFFHWHYSPLWALARRTMSFHFFLSATNSHDLLTPNT